MNIPSLPGWFLGALLALVATLLVVLLLGYSIEYSGGRIRIVRLNTTWTRVTETEPFDVECEYRWKVTGNYDDAYKGSYAYPTVVTRDLIHMNWSSHYQQVEAGNKQEVKIDGQRFSAEVYKRCS